MPLRYRMKFLCLKLCNIDGNPKVIMHDADLCGHVVLDSLVGTEI